MRRLFAFCFSYLCSALVCGFAGINLVVPFHNDSGESNLDWIGESIAETIRETIVSYGLPAVDRETREDAAHDLSIPPAKQLTKGTIIRLSHELGASRVLYGEFLFTPAAEPSTPPSGHLEIRAHCIDVAGGAHGPDWTEGGDLASLSHLQARLSLNVLRHLDSAKAPAEEEFFEAHPPVRIDAMESYVRGLLAPALEQKHRFFTQAVNLHPEFSQPCFQLGRMQWEEASYRTAAQWLEKVKPHDAHYLEANFLLGLCRYYAGDYSGAAAAFQLVARTAELDVVFNNLAVSQYRQREEAAADSLQRALEAAPGDPDYQFNAGYMLWRQGDLDGAQHYFSRTLELDPGDIDARQMLKRCQNQSPPRRGDLSSEGLERLKEDWGMVGRRLLEDRGAPTN